MSGFGNCRLSSAVWTLQSEGEPEEQVGARDTKHTALPESGLGKIGQEGGEGGGDGRNLGLCIKITLSLAGTIYFSEY